MFAALRPCLQRSAAAAAAATAGFRGLSTSISVRDKVVITGGSGNIGTKLATHLIGRGHDLHIVDPWKPEAPVEGASYHEVCMLGREGLSKVMEGTDAVIHLAAWNPYPEASWEDCRKSMEITMNCMSEAVGAGVGRFIFASSNHVMGGYKDLGGPRLAPGVGKIMPTSQPEVGTKWDAGGVWMDSTGYAAAKLAGEAQATSLAQEGYNGTQFVTVRIGWCQPGENRTNTMSAGGTPTVVVEEDAGAVEDLLDISSVLSSMAGNTQYDQDLILDWYRLMWLSNADCCQIFEKTIEAELPEGTPKHVIINGMSRNSGMRWDLSDSEKYFGYAPVDDAGEDVKYWASKK